MRTPTPGPPVLMPAERSAEALTDRPQAFLSAVLTEHFVLESARGITVSESSSRASLYLMTLSSSLVAFGFLADTRYAGQYLAVAIPVVVLLGVFTYERLVQTSLEDVVALAAIQRIRRFYGTLLPGAEAFFVVPERGDGPNEMLEIGGSPSWRGVFFTMSTAIAAVNSVLAGAGIAFVCHAVGVPPAATVVGGGAGAVALVVLHGWYQERRYSAVTRRCHPTNAPRR